MEAQIYTHTHTQLNTRMCVLACSEHKSDLRSAPARVIRPSDHSGRCTQLPAMLRLLACHLDSWCSASTALCGSSACPSDCPSTELSALLHLVPHRASLRCWICAVPSQPSSIRHALFTPTKFRPLSCVGCARTPTLFSSWKPLLLCLQSCTCGPVCLSFVHSLSLSLFV